MRRPSFSLALFFLSNLAFADRISFVENPEEVMYEPHQRAIVAWNGSVEKLVLSTTLSQPNPGVRVEFLPLPSSTLQINLYDAKVFERLSALAAKKGVDLRAFDEKSATSSLLGEPNVQHFDTTDELLNFLADQCNTVDTRVINVIDDYMRRNNHDFIVDDVYVTSEAQNFPLIAQEFKSPRLYYPLQDSSVNQTGNTTIDLLVISPKPVTFSEIDHPIETLSSFSLNAEELQGIDLSTDWAGYMGTDIIYLQHIEIKSDLHSLTEDLFGDFKEI
jgi:hypothetical protein